MARVVLSEDAVEDFEDLDGGTKRLVGKALRKLRDSPEKRGAPLGRRSAGNLTTFRKLGVGDRDYRIIYRIDPDGSVVVVWVIGKRADNEAYELAMSRLRMHGNAGVRELATSLEEIRQGWLES